MNGNNNMNEIYNGMNERYNRINGDDYREFDSENNRRNSYDNDEMNRMYDEMRNNVNKNTNNYMKDRECNGIKHKVQEGDTLYKISRMHNVSIGDLIEANRYMNIYDISPGDVICVPVDEEDDNNLDNDLDNNMNDNSESMHGNGKWMVYIIEDGDTLDKVLALFDMDFDEFMDANKQNGVLLKPGSIVVVPNTLSRR